jgi:hypothetical protein
MKKFCVHGHRRIKKNLYKPPHGNPRCQICHLEQKKIAYRKTHPVFLDPNRIRYARHCSPRSRFSDSKYGAMRRGHKWTLSYEFYCSLLQKPCYYCGLPLQKTKGGMDRSDNKKGYTPENVRPCCRRCNWMKNTMNEAEYFDHLSLIIKTHKSRLTTE